MIERCSSVELSRAMTKVRSVPAPTYGVRFAIEGGRRVLISTDGYRVAKHEIPHAEGVSEEFTLAWDTAETIRKWAGRAISVTYETVPGGVRFEFRFDHRVEELTVPTFDGTYPSYQAMFPPKVDTVYTDRATLLDVIKLVSACPDDTIELDVVEGLITVRSLTSRQEGEIGAALSTRNGFAVSYRAEDLADALRMGDTRGVKIRISGRAGPSVIETGRAAYALLPVR